MKTKSFITDFITFYRFLCYYPKAHTIRKWLEGLPWEACYLSKEQGSSFAKIHLNKPQNLSFGQVTPQWSFCHRTVHGGQELYCLRCCFLMLFFNIKKLLWIFDMYLCFLMLIFIYYFFLSYLFYLNKFCALNLSGQVSLNDPFYLLLYVLFA